MAERVRPKGPKKQLSKNLKGSATRLLRIAGSGNLCGHVKVGAHQPANIKAMVLAAIGAPANTPDKTQISALMNASTGNPIWEAAIQCMHYGQFNTDELTPMPIYFNKNGASVGGFVSCIQCCYSHPQ